MTPPLCAECAKPILPTESASTLQQVDACTLAVERLAYHSTCWDQKVAKSQHGLSGGGDVHGQEGR